MDPGNTRLTRKSLRGAATSDKNVTVETSADISDRSGEVKAVRAVASVDELLAVVDGALAGDVVVRGALTGVPSFRLAEGQNLKGGAGDSIAFADGADGVQFSQDNVIAGLRLETVSVNGSFIPTNESKRSEQLF
jgi:hypothetical protein